MAWPAKKYPPGGPPQHNYAPIGISDYTMRFEELQNYILARNSDIKDKITPEIIREAVLNTIPEVYRDTAGNYKAPMVILQNYGGHDTKIIEYIRAKIQEKEKSKEREREKREREREGREGEERERERKIGRERDMAGGRKKTLVKRKRIKRRKTLKKQRKSRKR
jgi:hypothetical protein